MISLISGKLLSGNDGFAVIDTGGVGYRLFISKNCQSGLPAFGETVTLFAHLHAREDALQLYGFLDEEERELFLNLISISKIGPKLALSILSYSPDKLKTAIVRKDLAMISSIPGVGKKTAERLVLELKEKLELPDVLLEDETEAVKPEGEEVKVARQALLNLGFSPAEVAEVMKDETIDEGEEAEVIVRNCLRILSEGNAGSR